LPGLDGNSALEFVVAGRLQRHQLIAQVGREGCKGGCDRADRALRKVGQHAIDAVEASAGHQANEQIGCHMRRVDGCAVHAVMVG
jgi:hypothetical protein